MVEFTKQALEDLENIRAHIAREYPERAARIAANIINKCKLLDSSPQIGRPGREAGTRELSTAQPWVIVYDAVDKKITILRIWHSRQSRE